MVKENGITGQRYSGKNTSSGQNTAKRRGLGHFDVLYSFSVRNPTNCSEGLKTSLVFQLTFPSVERVDLPGAKGKKEKRKFFTSHVIKTARDR